MKKTKKTVGAQAVEAAQDTPGSISVMEQQAQMQSEYMKYLLEQVDIGYEKYKNTFYIEVQTKNEKLLTNVFRNYFIDRKTCPTPNYDQSVYRYNMEKGQVEYLWTVPSRDACFHLLENRDKVVQEERGLLEFVLLYARGDLLKLCKKLNNELEHSTILA
jgi:hypothetical protein